MRLILKIVPRALWAETYASGAFAGAPVDLADGFIHFSTPEQVRETAVRHFAGQRNLLVVAVDADTLGANLRWEASRGGALFPHLYAPLAVKNVLWVRMIATREDGTHDLSGIAA